MGPGSDNDQMAAGITALVAAGYQVTFRAGSTEQPDIVTTITDPSGETAATNIAAYYYGGDPTSSFFNAIREMREQTRAALTTLAAERAALLEDVDPDDAPV